MQLLDNALIKDEYEVIVVGAGIGGLTTAALLAKRGIDVLLIEQHYMPGGCCAAIRRQGITMDVAATVLYGFGEKGYNVHRFVMNELEEEIDMIPRQAIYNMHVSGDQIVFWRDFKPFFENLVSLFPHQEKELQVFYDYLFNLYESTILKSESVVPPTEMSPLDNMKTFMSNPVGMIKISRLMFKSAGDLFREFFTDAKIIDFLDMLTRTFSYVDADECPAVLSVTMFADNHIGGAYYPSGSPQMLSNKLERAIERHGSQILYRHLVDEILISRKKAYGVRLTNGTRITADRVVSDASIWNLYGKLVRPKHIKPKRMKWAQGFVPCHSNLILYIGVDAKALTEDAKPMEIIIEDAKNVAGHGITIYIPTLQDPTVSPPGTCSVTITSVSSITWPRPGDPEYQSEKYQRLKQHEADKVLDRVEKRFPDFRKHIKVMEIATPSTVERYTLKNWGNTGGPKQMIGQEMMKRLKARSDWKNLYQCGDSTVLGLGVLPATTSGVGAANMVLKDMGRKLFYPRSFTRQYINFIKGKPWTPPPAATEPIADATAAARAAQECQHCHEAGCTKACPAGIDLVGVHRRIEAGNIPGASRALREKNPLAEICGHICPAERLCQKDCNRLDFSDQPTRIADLHAWVCEETSGRGGWNRTMPSDNGLKVAVIGAGPAGLSCAHFLARLGYRVDISEKGKKPGGLMTQAIPAFRLPDKIVEREIEGLTLEGMNFQFGKALGQDFTVADLEKDYDAVFLSPGLGTGRKLNIDGVKDANTTDALSLLRTSRNQGKAKVGKNVLVIGGGSVAADAALAARASGADKVSLICLEKKDEMPALASEVAELGQQDIEIHDGWGPKAFLSAGKISLSACTSVFDSQGGFRPQFDESRSMEMEFDQVVWAIGQATESTLAGYLKEEFDCNGLIEINPDTMQVRNRPRIFAGGDIVRGAGTVIQAVADGRKAAMAMDALLRRN